MSKHSYSPSPEDENIICTDYLSLNPEKASLCDVFRFVWPSENERKHEFIESPEELAQDFRVFRYRWLVFISILVQKFLLKIQTPLAFSGSVIDFWLNLVTINGGVLKLFINLITGKMEIPKESKETYRSIIGNLDTRIELDPSIPMGHPRYPPALSSMAAKLSYENSAFIKSVVERHWKMELLGSYDFWNDFQDKSSTHGFMARSTRKDGTDLTVVAFSGTNPFRADDWCTDFDISWLGLSGVGRVHAGFMKDLGLQKMGGNGVGWPKEVDVGPGKPVFAYYKIREVLRKIVRENKNAKFIVTGHSLGGALAILFASVLTLHDEKELLDRLEGVYTFGQPRVGDEEFGEFMKKKLETYNVRYCRYVYCNDMVPRLPYDDKTLLFKHFGPCLFVDSFYNGKELPEEPNRNYFSPIWVIPKYMNAWWELIRGFVLPHLKWGSEYEEGWCETTFRVIGLLIPGLSAHGPQDYDNLTRLGRLPLPQHPKDKSN